MPQIRLRRFRRDSSTPKSSIRPRDGIVLRLSSTAARTRREDSGRTSPDTSCVSSLVLIAGYAKLMEWMGDRVVRDKIGDVSIKLQFGSDEAWTRALRHVRSLSVPVGGRRLMTRGWNRFCWISRFCWDERVCESCQSADS